MEPLPNENGTSSPLQRLLIGAGAFIVIVLTIVAAIFLAMQDVPDGQSTPMAQVSPTQAVGITPVLTPPTVTPTASPLPPTNTPTATLTPSATPQPPVETTRASDTPQSPPTATDTLEPPPPTFTPVPVPPTNTPTPAALTNCGSPPPTDWIAYTVQPNETLDSIARRSDTSVFEVQQTNCLASINIQSGQIIYLPAVPVTVTPTYTPTIAPTRGATPTRTGTPIAPKIFNVIAQQTDTQIIVIVEGENFRSQEAGFKAELIGPTVIVLNLGNTRTSTGFEASAPIPPDLPDTLLRGAYDLVVTNPNGRFATRTGVFPPGNATPTATPAPPDITRVSPSSGRISEDVRLTVQGREFRPLEPGFKVEIRLDNGNLTVELFVDEAERPATSTSFDVVIGAGSLSVGNYDLLVTNPDGQTDIERDAYNAFQ